MIKKNKYDFKIQHEESGVSIWYGGRWIVDASTILEDGEVTICSKRMKKQDSNYYDHILYAFDDTYDLKEQEREIAELRSRLKELEKKVRDK